MKDRNRVDHKGKKGLGEVEGGEIMIRVYCMRKDLFSMSVRMEEEELGILITRH